MKNRSKDWLLTKKYFTVMECTDCSFLFTNPRPETRNLSQYYLSSDYISHTDSKKKFTDYLYFLVKKYMFQRKLNLLKQVSAHRDLKHLQILDFGCATGDFVLFLNKKNIKVIGYEPEKSAVFKARKKGVKVLNDIGELDNPKYDGFFSMITLWHVFEHLPNPLETLTLLKKLLSENGTLVVALPNHQSFDAKFYNSDWAAWDLPRHLNHFNDKTISYAMKKKRFSLMKTSGMPFDAFYVALLSEKNLGNKGFFALIKAFFVGLYANLNALFNRFPYSSQIYIFRKS
ncbi:MAG: class I SAM-dependent methyltransferase [bacterium]